MKYFVLIAAVLLITIRACVCTSGSAPEPSAVQSTDPTAAAKDHSATLGISAKRLVGKLEQIEGAEYHIKWETPAEGGRVFAVSNASAAQVILDLDGDLIESVILTFVIASDTTESKVATGLLAVNEICNELFIERLTALNRIAELISKMEKQPVSDFVCEDKTILVLQPSKNMIVFQIKRANK